MIINFDNPESLKEYNTDLCIIGSGAAAMAIVSGLQQSGLEIIILEEEDKKEDLQVNGPTLRKPGSTEISPDPALANWGSDAVPYDKNDFAKRDWVPFSGWPIGYAEVENYYEKVDRFLQIDPLSYDTDIYQLIKKNPLAVDKDLLLGFSKTSPKQDLRQTQRQQVAIDKSIHLVRNASLTHIELTENGQAIREVCFTNLQGRKGKVRATRYVLACSAIENARMLLSSNKQNINGIGNDEDLVGRFLQDQHNAPIGKITSDNKQIQDYYNYFYVKNTRFLPRFRISEQFQRENRILNSSAHLEFISDENDPIAVVKAFYNKSNLQELSARELKASINLFRYLPEMLQISKRYFINRQVYTPKPVIQLKLTMEMPPAPDNRVRLSEKTDAMGRPLAQVSRKFDDQVFHTLGICAGLFEKHFTNSGFGKLELESWIKDREYEHHLVDAKQQIGTTRMSSSAKDGVVDANCKVHSIENLYVSGGSVLPTSGHANPTSTAVALSFRLADHLKGVMG